MMDKPKRERYLARLEALVARLQPDIESITESARRPSGGQTAGDLSNAPLHLGDMGTDEFLQDLDATLMANEENLTGKVRAALTLLDDGSFGICEMCGESISQERLEGIAYARYCMKCAEADDTAVANLHAGRP